LTYNSNNNDINNNKKQMDNPFSIKRELPSTCTLNFFINILGNQEQGLVEIIKDIVIAFINSHYKWWWLNPNTGKLNLYYSYLIQKQLECHFNNPYKFYSGNQHTLCLYVPPSSYYTFHNSYHGDKCIYYQKYIDTSKIQSNYCEEYKTVIRICRDNPCNIEYPQIYYDGNFFNKFSMSKIISDPYSHSCHPDEYENTPVKIKQDLTII